MEFFARHTKLAGISNEHDVGRRWIALQAGGPEGYVSAGFDDFHALNARTQNPPLHVYYSSNRRLAVNPDDFARMATTIDIPSRKHMPAALQAHASHTGFGQDPKKAAIAYLIAAMGRNNWEKLSNACFGEELGEDVVKTLKHPDIPQPRYDVIGFIVKSMNEALHEKHHVILTDEEVAASLKNMQTPCNSPVTQALYGKDLLEGQRSWDPVVINEHRKALRMKPTSTDTQVAKEVFRQSAKGQYNRDLESLMTGPLEEAIDFWRPKPKQCDGNTTLHEHLKSYVMNGFK